MLSNTKVSCNKLLSELERIEHLFAELTRLKDDANRYQQKAASVNVFSKPKTQPPRYIGNFAGAVLGNGYER